MEVSRTLYELAQKYRSLENITFKRALRESGLTVLIVALEIDHTLEQRDSLEMEISRRLKTKIKMVKDNTDIRELAREIFVPAQIRGVNVLFKKEGGEEYHIKITREDLMLLPASIDVLQALLTKVTDKKIKLVFE